MKNQINQSFLSVSILLLFIITGTNALAQFGKTWDKDFGGIGAGNNDEYSTTIPTDDGGYLLAGSSNSNASFFKTNNSKGSFDFWIIKISPTGIKQWDKTFGGTNADVLNCIVRTSDGGYLLGGQSQSNQLAPDKSQNSFGSDDFWVLKIDANGNRLWDKTYGGNGSDSLQSIAITSTGFLLGGFSDSNANGIKTQNSKGVVDYWIISIDNNGNKLWDKTIGGTGYDYLTTVIPYSGGYLLAGYSSSNISFDKSESAKGPEGNTDYWAVKINTTGTKLWDITLGGFGEETLNSVVRTPDGGVLLGGHSFSAKNGNKTTDNFDPNNSADFWVVKIVEYDQNTKVSMKWDKSFGGDNHDLLYDMTRTSDGNYLLTGASISSPSGNKNYANKGGYDYWIVKMDLCGNKIWDTGYGGTNDDYLKKIIPYAGGYIVGGYSKSTLNGDKTQNTLGSNDYWILQLRSTNMFREFEANDIQINTKKTKAPSKDETINLYPNPASEQITITTITLENTLINTTIYSSLGIPVYDFSEINKTKNYLKTIDISKLQTGIYIVKIDIGMNSSSEKLIINR